MESFAQSTNMKRYVIQDSFTKVTSDGEPHEMMTLIAGLSGLLAAIIILAILVSLVGCKKDKKNIATTAYSSSVCSSGVSSQIDTDGMNDSKRSSILSIIRCDSNCIVDNIESDNSNVRSARHMSVATISNRNLEGNLNTAFVGSELNLNAGSVEKKNNRAVNENEIVRKSSVKISAKDIIINIEKY